MVLALTVVAARVSRKEKPIGSEDDLKTPSTS